MGRMKTMLRQQNEEKVCMHFHFAFLYLYSLFSCGHTVSTLCIIFTCMYVMYIICVLCMYYIHSL